MVKRQRVDSVPVAMYGRHQMHEEPETCGCGLVRSPARHRRGNQPEPVSRLYFDYIRVPR